MSGDGTMSGGDGTMGGAAVAARLHAWMTGTVLPFWAEAGRDAATGAFHERLLPDGTPDRAATRRLRVQARQIYVYAHAGALGWYPAGGALALAGFDAMMAAAHAPDGEAGFVHTLTPDGRVADARRDAYDHAFVVLALAWLLHATGEARVRAALAATLAFVDQRLTAPDGSLYEDTLGSLPRRQNPQMHWFEAMLALHEALAWTGAAERAARGRARLETLLWDPATRCLGEYFTDAWAPAPGEAGAVVEPGHQAEWCWLLRRHETLGGLPRGALASEMLESALRWADPASGLLVDEALRDGGVRKPTRRSWLQTELAKAWLAEAEAGRPDAPAAAAALVALERHHLGTPLAAGWTDQLDAACRPLPGPVPASTLYHVFVAVAEAVRVLGTAPRVVP